MISVVIQAGGASRRMGQDKGLVKLAGQPLVQHVLDRVAHLGDEVCITTNRPQAYAFLGLPTASDPEPGLGALVGLRTALQAVRGDTVLVVACDMPFLEPSLLRHLLSRAGEADVVIPRRNGEFEPLHAVYRRSCLTALEAALARGEARMISFFPDVRLLPIDQAELASYDPEGLSFFNVNTPDDLIRAERHLRAASSQPKEDIHDA
jgi:molybdenum cofactor guanylyltransferase